MIADTMQKHRRQEGLKFLKQIYGLVAKDKEIHIICDNHATHKTEAVRAWLATHRRVHVHFTPTPSRTSGRQLMPTFSAKRRGRKPPC